MKHKTMASTSSWRFLNNGDMINKNIAKMLKEAKILTLNSMDEQLITIKRNYHFPLKTEVLDAISSGMIRFVYNPTSPIPTSLPFFMLQNNDRQVSVFIPISAHGTYVEEDDRLSMDTKKFYTLAESALLSIKLLPKTELGLKTPLIKDGAVIYSAIFTRILNKAYALNTNKSKLDSILFISACFYLINVIGMDANKNTDVILNYAKAVCKNPNAIILEDYYGRFTNVNKSPFVDIESFIKRIIEMEPGFKNLTVRGYLEQYITTYGPAMLFSLEMLEYLIFNVIAVTHASFLNNQYVLEGLIANNGVKFYNAAIES